MNAVFDVVCFLHFTSSMYRRVILFFGLTIFSNIYHSILQTNRHVKSDPRLSTACFNVTPSIIMHALAHTTMFEWTLQFVVKQTFELRMSDSALAKLQNNITNFNFHRPVQIHISHKHSNFKNIFSQTYFSPTNHSAVSILIACHQLFDSPKRNSTDCDTST